MLAALFLRVGQLDAHGLWLDEFTSLCNATGQVKETPIGTGIRPFLARDAWHDNTTAGVFKASIQADGGNGILYYQLLHGWVGWFGTSDTAVRLPSALLGLLLVGLVARLAYLVAGMPAAVLAAVLAAVHPLLLTYSQEARGYALATCLAVTATLLFLRLIDEAAPEKRRLVLAVSFGLCACAALLSHYLTVEILLALGCFALWRCRKRSTWLFLSLSASIICAGMALWLGNGGNAGLALIADRNHLYQQRLHHPRADESFVLPATLGNVGAGLIQIACVMSGNQLQAGGAKLRQLIPWLVVPIALVGLATRHPQRGKRASPATWLLVMIAASHPLLSTLMALKSGHIISFQTNYANFATPALVVLMAMGAVQLVRRPMLAGAVMLIWGGVTLWSVHLVGFDAPKFRPPNHYARLASDLDRLVGRDEVVEFPTWQDAHLCNLYWSPTAAIPQRRVRTPDRRTVRVLRGSREIASLPLPPLP